VSVATVLPSTDTQDRVSDGLEQIKAEAYEGIGEVEVVKSRIIKMTSEIRRAKSASDMSLPRARNFKGLLLPA
jgi:hypothetical protein